MKNRIKNKTVEEITLENYHRTFLADFAMTDAVSVMQDLIVYDCGREQCVGSKYVNKGIKPYYLFHYVRSGKGTFIQNGKRYTVQAGEMFAIFPHCVVEWFPDKKEPWLYEWFSVGGRLADSYVANSGITLDNPVVSINKSGRIQECIDEIVTHYYQSDSINLGCIANLYFIFHELIEAKARLASKVKYKNSYINEAIMFMRYNLGTKILIKDIAYSLNLNPSYFVWLFTETVGISPKQYLINYRIKIGARILRERKRKIEEVAKEVGYDDPLHFSREFKKVMGVCPRDYVRVNS